MVDDLYRTAQAMSGRPDIKYYNDQRNQAPNMRALNMRLSLILFLLLLLRGVVCAQDWVPVNNGLRGDVVVDYAFGANGEMLVTTANGIYGSSDAGDHWQRRSDTYALHLISTADGTFFAILGTNQSLYRSTDNGWTWK